MSVLAGFAQRRENRLLAALPDDDYQRLLPQLTNVSFTLGQVVYEFGGKLDYVYFPTTAIVSLLYTMENGSSAEMGLTGNDGVVGIALFMGGGLHLFVTCRQVSVENASCLPDLPRRSPMHKG